MNAPLAFHVCTAVAVLSALPVLALSARLPIWAIRALIGTALGALAGMALAMSETFPG